MGECFVVLIVVFGVDKKLTIGKSGLGGSLLRMKSNFIRLLSSKLDINLKLNKGSDLLRKGSRFDQVDLGRMVVSYPFMLYLVF